MILWALLSVLEPHVFIYHGNTGLSTHCFPTKDRLGQARGETAEVWEYRGGGGGEACDTSAASRQRRDTGERIFFEKTQMI